MIQDDEKDVKPQVGEMGQVYAGASFMIIAAAGVNADTGLPGSRNGTRHASHTIVSDRRMGFIRGQDGAALMTTLNPLLDVGNDYWT